MGRIHNLNRKVGRMGLLNLLYLTSMPTEHKNKYFVKCRYGKYFLCVSIQGNYVYYICLDNFSICRENSCLLYIQGWKKITSKQFKNAYLAVMKDIQDPDLGSNWNTVYNSIVTSVNS